MSTSGASGRTGRESPAEPSVVRLPSADLITAGPVGASTAFAQSAALEAVAGRRATETHPRTARHRYTDKQGATA